MAASKAQEAGGKVEAAGKAAVDDRVEGGANVVELTGLRVDRIVDRHMLAALGVGMVPIPVVDLIGVTGIQINMLRRLSEVYGIEFSKNGGRNVLAALIGGAIPAYGAFPLAYLLRNVPVIGWTLGAGAGSLLAGATTYAVGHVLARHFETGGTMEDFDADQAKGAFKEFFAKGKEKVAGLRKKKDAAATAASDVASEAAGTADAA